MARMDWNKARKFKEYEEKYTPGLRLHSGRVVSNTPRDSLDARAKAAESKWMKGIEAKKKRALPFIKKAQRLKKAQRP
jgi:hypothetical protein